jgi:hypothetical protein
MVGAIKALLHLSVTLPFIIDQSLMAEWCVQTVLTVVVCP